MSFEKALAMFGRGLDMIQAMPAPKVPQTRTVADLIGDTTTKRRGPVAKAAAPKISKPVRAVRTQRHAAPTTATPKAQPVRTQRAASNAVAAGRRAVANGDRPKFAHAIALVMGGKTLGAADIVEGLREKNWMPNTPEENVQNYVSYTLSNNEEMFERVARGQYRVIDGVIKDIKSGVKLGKAPRAASKSDGTAKGSKATAKAAPATQEVAAPVSGGPVTEVASTPASSDIDAELEDLGIGKDGVKANPF